MSLSSGPYPLTTYPWAKTQRQIGRKAISPLLRYGQSATLMLTSVWLGLSLSGLETVMIFGRGTPLLVGVGGLLTLLMISRVWNAEYHRLINASAFRAGSWHAEVTDEGLCLESANVRQVFAWHVITEVRDGPDSVLVMLGPVFFLPVPTAAFSNDADATAFRRAIEARISAARGSV